MPRRALQRNLQEIDGLLRCLWAFDGAGSTAEDRQRARRYREERTRRTVREASSSRREFIAGLLSTAATRPAHAQQSATAKVHHIAIVDPSMPVTEMNES